MKIIKLIYNEIYKQVKKISFLIFFILIIIFTFTFSLINKFLGNTDTFFMNSEVDYYENYVYNKDAKDYDGLLVNELATISIENMKYSVDKKISYDDFRALLITEITNYKHHIAIINRLINGEEYTKISKSLKKADEELYIFYLDVSQYSNMSKEELEKEKKDLETRITDCTKVIEENDYSWYIKEELKLFKEEQKELNPKDLVEKEILEGKIKLYEYYVSKDIKDQKDLRIVTGFNIMDNYQYLNEEKYTELDYNSMNLKISYKDYEKLYDDKMIYLRDQIKMDWYSIENNENYNNTDAKKTFNSYVSNIMPFLGLVIVVIAGGIVANEFQKGTIRLLLVRPNKRWKILLSKFLAVIIITIFLVISATLVAFIINGILYGFDGYFISSLKVVDGKVKEVSFILLALKNIGLLLIPVLFAGLGAFTLSTITNNTAVSVGLGIFILVGGSLALMILTLIKVPLLDYTFLPYLDYNIFLNAFDLELNNQSYQLMLTLPKANIVLASWSVVFYTVSHLIFIKKDIKN